MDPDPTPRLIALVEKVRAGNLIAPYAPLPAPFITDEFVQEWESRYAA